MRGHAVLSRARRLLLAAVLLAGCDPWSLLPTRKDPAYCDDATPCTDPLSPRCDPATHACTAASLDSGVPADLGPDLGVPCSDSNACPADRPLCEASRCRACAGAVDDAACRARSSDAPRCGPAGACVACLPASQTSDCPAVSPICDASACRVCRTNLECPTGVCRKDGACEAPASVAWVDNGGKSVGDCLASGTHDGASRATAFCDIQSGVDARLRRPNLVIRGGGYDAFRVESGALRVVGPGAFDGFSPGEVTVRSSQARTPAVYATGDLTTLVVEDLRVGGGSGAAGIDCYSDLPSVQLTLRAVWTQGGAAGDGVLVEPNCLATVDGVQAPGSDGAGLRVRGGSAVVTRLRAAGNGTGVALEDGFLLDNVPGALDLDASDVVTSTTAGVVCAGVGSCTVTNTLVAGNGTPGAGQGGVRLAPTLAAVTFDLDTVVRNLDVGGVGGVDCGLNGTAWLTNSIVIGNSMGSGSQLGASCILSAVVTGAADRWGTPRDPVFVDPIGDYHLVAGDPQNGGAGGCCIDKALEPQKGRPYLAHDHDGNPRPRGPGSDIGAYEVQ